jgi:hypothetical protein
VLSEPPFLATLVIIALGMVAMARQADAGKPRAIGWPLATGLAGAAAVMLRYAGLPLVAAAAWWAFASPVGPRETGDRVWPARFRRAALVLAPTVCTLGPWFLRTEQLGGSHSVRTFGIYPGFGATASEGVHTIANWLAPIGSGTSHALLAALSAFMVVWVLVGAWRRLRRVEQRGVDAALPVEDVDRDAIGRAARDGSTETSTLLHSPPVGATRAPPPPDAARRSRVVLQAAAYLGVAYLLFLAASRLFGDAYIPFDERLLAPVLLLAAVAVAVALPVWWRVQPRAARIAAALVLSAWVAASIFTSVQTMAVARDDGGDFAGIDWQDSPTIAWVRDSAGGLHRTLYTNWPPAVYFQAGRASHDLPAVLDPLTLRRFHDRLSRTRGVLVAFNTPSPDVAPPQALAQALGLREIARYADGTVWDLPEDSAAAR